MAELNPAEQAAIERCLAGLREIAIARHRLSIAMHETAGALRNFADAWHAAEQRITEAEALELAAHPDVAAVDVYLEGFYG